MFFKVSSKGDGDIIVNSDNIVSVTRLSSGFSDVPSNGCAITLITNDVYSLHDSFEKIESILIAPKKEIPVLSNHKFTNDVYPTEDTNKIYPDEFPDDYPRLKDGSIDKRSLQYRQHTGRS